MNVRALLASAALAAAVVVSVPASANAAEPTRRDCRTTDTGTTTERACENRGWLIERKFAVGPRDWVQRNELEPCATGEGDTNCYATDEVRYTKYSGYRLVEYVNGFRR